MTEIKIDADSLFEECVNQSLIENNDPNAAIDESHRDIFKSMAISLSLDVESAIRCRLKSTCRGYIATSLIFENDCVEKCSLSYKIDDTGINPEELAIRIRDFLKSGLMSWWYLSRNSQLSELYGLKVKELRSRLVFITKGDRAVRPYRLY